jgi:coiled-coil domain-containing protein 55
MKLSISLNKPKVVQTPAPIKRPSAFSLTDDGDTEDNGLLGKSQGKTEPLAHNAHSSQAMRRRMEAEKRVDETVFEYDEVWDKMQEAKQRQQASKEADASLRKVASALFTPCLLDSSLNSRNIYTIYSLQQPPAN